MIVYKEYPKKLTKNPELMSNYNKLTEWKIDIHKSFVFQCTSNEQLKSEIGMLFKSVCKSKQWVINLANIYLREIIKFWVQTQRTMEGHSSGMDRKLHNVKILIRSSEIDL